MGGYSRPFPTNGNIIMVGPAQPYKTIQAAIDASAPFDLIRVERGTYAEDLSVTVNRSINAGWATIVQTNGMAVADGVVMEIGALITPAGKQAVMHTGTTFASVYVSFMSLVGAATNGFLSTGAQFFARWDRLSMSGGGGGIVVGSISSAIGQADYQIDFRNTDLAGTGGALYATNDEANRCLISGGVAFQSTGTGASLNVCLGSAANTIRNHIGVVDLAELSNIPTSTDANLITSTLVQPIVNAGAGKLYLSSVSDGLDMLNDQNAFTLFSLQNPNAGAGAMAGGFMAADTASIYLAAVSDAFNVVPAYAGQAGLLLASGDAIFIGGKETREYTGTFTNEVLRKDISVEGLMTIYGGQAGNVTTVSAATYDLLVTDYILNVTYTGTGAVTSLTLPTAQTVSGRKIKIKDAGDNASVNNITVDTEGGQLIDGAADLVISSDSASVSLYCDGTNWFIY